MKSTPQMSEMYAGQALQTGGGLKNQENQRIGCIGWRGLPSYAWLRSE
jgi:hypothetical protein